MMNKQLTRWTIGALIALSSQLAFSGDVVVIGNKDNAAAVDKAFVAKIYTGEAKSWPDGAPVVAFDQAEDSPARAAFLSEVVGKTPANMKSLWAQNIFSGKGLPPKPVGGDDDVKKAVAGNKNAIGYVKAASVDASVRVLVK